MNNSDKNSVVRKNKRLNDILYSTTTNCVAAVKWFSMNNATVQVSIVFDLGDGYAIQYIQMRHACAIMLDLSIAIWKFGDSV